jgi:hypothetical protein
VSSASSGSSGSGLRKIVPYIRRDYNTWWAGCRYEAPEPGELPYISEDVCMSRWGATRAAKKMARKARRLRDRSIIGFKTDVGEPE